MKIFVDSANLDEIKTALSWHLADGVTTNPSSLGNSEKEPVGLVRQITQIVKGPVSMQVTTTSKDDMVREGKRIAKLAKNIVVKLPVSRDGLLAIYELAKLGIPINATNLFTPAQALIASRNGATYASCWMGRSDDIYMDGLRLVSDTKEIFENYGIKTQILACSIKNTKQVVQVAKIGADIATLPFAVIEEMTFHPMTNMTFDSFLNDWNLNPALKKSP